MNARLRLIASLIPDSTGFADIGTDHGYLPAYMASRGYSGRIIAADIKEIPLSTAVSTAREYGVEDIISFRLCDGLDAIEPSEIDTIIIAGMGGDTISGILDRAEWCMDGKYLLLLQPMTKCEILRYWLCYNGFAILREDLISDNGETYQIISARFTGENMPLSDAELFTGKYELARGNTLFYTELTHLIRRFERALCGMDKAKRTIARRELNAEILRELEKMKELEDNEKSK